MKCFLIINVYISLTKDDYNTSEENAFINFKYSKEIAVAMVFEALRLGVLPPSQHLGIYGGRLGDTIRILWSGMKGWVRIKLPLTIEHKDYTNQNFRSSRQQPTKTI